jgi:hypothetical protein
MESDDANQRPARPKNQVAPARFFFIVRSVTIFVTRRFWAPSGKIQALNYWIKPTHIKP